jgi:signal transduction histidine kinase
MIDGDPVQMVQLFQNLLSNSLKFHRPDVPPQVRVSARRDEAGWTISVCDNGIGIAVTKQDVFDVFRRLHPGTSYPGSGIGLAICRRIVQRHGGRIWYETEEGKGTCFFFTVPLETMDSTGSAADDLSAVPCA